MLAILIDEMYGGISDKLRDKGYEAISVLELKDLGFNIHHDYSVIKYAEENDMILVTRDKKSYLGCLENNIPAVQMGENPTVEEIIDAVKKFEILP